MNEYVIKISEESTTYLNGLGFYSKEKKHIPNFFEYFSINLETKTVIYHTSHELLYQEVSLITLPDLKAIVRDEKLDNILKNE